jgi:hypothetical protein
LLRRTPKEYILLLVLCCFLIASVHAQTDTVSRWQIYLNDSLLISDNMARLSMEQKPVSVNLSLRNIKPKSTITIYYNSDKPSKNRQQLYLAREDSTRITQRYFRAKRKVIIAVQDLLDLHESELLLYFSNGPVIEPGPRPLGHVIGKIILTEGQPFKKIKGHN